MDFGEIKGLLREFTGLNEPLSQRELEEISEVFSATRQNFGPDIVFYLPGTIRLGHLKGKYPAVSITGENCLLLCEHCKGQLLKPMWKVREGESLEDLLLRIHQKGYHGCLLTGGANLEGMLPWESYLKAIEWAGENTSLYLSAHTGFVSPSQADALFDVGIRQGLIDVMGSDEVAQKVYHLKSLRHVVRAGEAIKGSGMEFIPHIVAGLFHGTIRDEFTALDLLLDLEPDALIIVTLSPLRGTPMEKVFPPSPQEVAGLIRKARRLFPKLRISLGCERKRGRYSTLLECLAILNGVNGLAVWSEEVLGFAKALGLNVYFQLTCCSLKPHPPLLQSVHPVPPCP